MSNFLTQSRRDKWLLGVLAVLVGALGLMKFLVTMLDAGPADSPWIFLLVLVIPFLVGRLLLPSHPRVGAALIGVFAALFAVICALALIQGIEPFWVDYVLVFAGGPLAVAAVWLAVRVLRAR